MATLILALLISNAATLWTTYQVRRSLKLWERGSHWQSLHRTWLEHTAAQSQLRLNEAARSLISQTDAEQIVRGQ